MGSPPALAVSGAQADITQALASSDARMFAAYEASGRMVELEQVVELNRLDRELLPPTQVVGYQQVMTRGGTVQTFGSFLIISPDTFTILAYSENANTMLWGRAEGLLQDPPLGPLAVTLGMDARQLLMPESAAALWTASYAQDFASVNPVGNLVPAGGGDRRFYAILSGAEGGNLAVTLEPMDAGALGMAREEMLVRRAPGMVGKAVTRLEAVSSGDVESLCRVVVEEVRQMMGYDRVLVYKFHEDEHGEVIAESHRPGVESFLGLHYPATDIPQAARFLAMKEPVRMIVDAHDPQCKLVQDPTALGTSPVNMVGVSVRSPHRCHRSFMRNMHTAASLTMGLTVVEAEEPLKLGAAGPEEAAAQRRWLWGMMVCHHDTPRFIPYPVRQALIALLRVFGLQLDVEVRLAAEMRERAVFRVQTVLTGMLMQESLLGLITESPSMMDLVKCDGAALYFMGRCWTLGNAPSEEQVLDLVQWLVTSYDISTGITTDSLRDANCPQAEALMERVCGMAAARISEEDFLFWFRGPTEKEVHWAGEKHVPEKRGKRGVVPEGVGLQEPRASFKSFLEVVKGRSAPWEDVEVDAIFSLQTMLRGTLQRPGDRLLYTHLNELDVKTAAELGDVAEEMSRIVESISMPVLAVDPAGKVHGWNRQVARLTGISSEAAWQRPFIADLVHPDSSAAVAALLGSLKRGAEESSLPIKLLREDAGSLAGPSTSKGGRARDPTPDGVTLLFLPCCSRDQDGALMGTFFVGQDALDGVDKEVDGFGSQGNFTRLADGDELPSHSAQAVIPAMFGVSKEGRCTTWNAQAVALTGVTRSEALGRLAVGEVFGQRLPLEGESTGDRLRQRITVVQRGRSVDVLKFAFLGKGRQRQEVVLTARRRRGVDGENGASVVCYLQAAVSGADIPEEADACCSCLGS